MADYRIKIEGMGCAMCVKRVTGALEGLNAKNISVELGSASASFGGDEKEIRDAIEELGFGVTAIEKA